MKNMTIIVMIFLGIILVTTNILNHLQPPHHCALGSRINMISAQFGIMETVSKQINIIHSFACMVAA